ncbi:hypothetical protein LJC15_01655 [Desulfovibrio sp. OttesenSCG-928-G11]|nr:hypothetical protein [Desulfovibrio sp. OttesenSCG-928-G11]
MKLTDFMLLTICAGLTTIASVLLKYAAVSVESFTIKSTTSMVFLKFFVPAIVMYCLAMGLWILSLKRISLNMAYPTMIGLNFVFIIMASFFIASEDLAIKTVIGCLTVFVGIIIIGI